MALPSHAADAPVRVDRMEGDLAENSARDVAQMKTKLTLQQLQDLLTYDPITGELRWKSYRSWRAPAGSLAGTLNAQGYIQVRVNGKFYPAHRLGWFLTYGKWPENLIDHINRNRSDNRLINLREATYSENFMNSGINARNTSGVRGVYWSKKDKRWIARLFVHKKLVKIGYFCDLEAASEAYKAAAKAAYGEFIPEAVR